MRQQRRPVRGRSIRKRLLEWFFQEENNPTPNLITQDLDLCGGLFFYLLFRVDRINGQIRFLICVCLKLSKVRMVH